MTDDAPLARLGPIVGRRHLLTGQRRHRAPRPRLPLGRGVVRPGTPQEQWRVLQACVEADKIVIMQVANTRLPDGSAPSGRYDRGVVQINTRRMNKLELLHDGTQVISLPGAR